MKNHSVQDTAGTLTDQARIKHILASSPAVLYSFKASGDYAPTFVSENLRKVFGYEPSEYLEDRNFVLERIQPEDAARVKGGLSLLFEKGYLINEYRFRHKDGSYRWVSDELKVIYDEAGKPVEVMGSWSDITAHKEAEAAAEVKLKNEAERYELVTRALSEGVYDWQPIDDKLLVSDRQKRLFNFHEDQFESRHWLERIHPDDRAGYRAAIRAHFKGNSDHFEHEYRIRIGDGQYRWVRDQATSLRRKDGRVWRLVGSITDVTEMKQREQELAEADQKKSALLTELNAVLDAIDYGISGASPTSSSKRAPR
ncbi:MAG: hypothetical protein EWM72_03343 [Nitrospira sp.]|nr:MAG: hypothetical protein EWM72_03343 [Nitrospira sp.]